MLERLTHLADPVAAGLWLGVASIVTLTAAALAVPWLLARLPRDYFVARRRPRKPFSGRPLTAWPLVLAKNAAGLLLVVLGCVMLVTPGQGVLALIAGLTLVDFPGKYRLQRRAARVPGVLRAINAMRAWRGQPPMLPPPERNRPTR